MRLFFSSGITTGLPPQRSFIPIRSVIVSTTRSHPPGDRRRASISLRNDDQAKCSPPVTGRVLSKPPGQVRVPDAALPVGQVAVSGYHSGGWSIYRESPVAVFGMLRLNLRSVGWTASCVSITQKPTESRPTEFTMPIS
jgi:hypothetical protein